MGFFGSLLGWDQSMGAINALMADYYIKNAATADLKAIANEVASIVSSVQKRGSKQALLQRLSKENRITQMNFVALACDNLGVPPPFPKCVWSGLKTPTLSERK